MEWWGDKFLILEELRSLGVLWGGDNPLVGSASAWRPLLKLSDGSHDGTPVAGEPRFQVEGLLQPAVDPWDCQAKARVFQRRG